MLMRAMFTATLAVLISCPAPASSFAARYRWEGSVIGRQTSRPIRDAGSSSPPNGFSRTRRSEPDLPAVVPPGPDNPMGSHALRLSSRALLIHGTNRPWGIGTRSSQGCIRLYPEDIPRLFKMVRRGTPVAIVNQPVKAAASGDRVYLEVHDYGDGKDLYGKALKVLEEKRLTSRIDLEKIRKASMEKKGLLVDVSK